MNAKRIFCAAVVVAIVKLGGFAQPLPKFVFSSEQAARWLWYIRIQNAFDSCAIEYEFGEVAVFDSSTVKLVYIRVPYREVGYGGSQTYPKRGIRAVGIDTVLEKECTTQPFVVPVHGKIRFYRNLSAVLYCDTTIRMPHGGEPYPLTRPINTVDRRWTLYPGWNPDQSEFVIQAVRESDGRILWTLDSIGVLPNPDSDKPVRYGTEPDRRVCEREFPPAVWGEKVYLRISPRRYGPAPLGMYMTKGVAWIARSLQYPNSDTLAIQPAIIDSAYMAGLWEEWNRAIFEYADSLGRCTGCVLFVPMFVDYAGDTLRQQQLLDSLRQMIDRKGYIRYSTRDPYNLTDTTFQRCLAEERQRDERYWSTFDDYDGETQLLARSYSNSIPPFFERLSSSLSNGEQLQVVTPILREGEPLLVAARADMEQVVLDIYDIGGRWIQGRRTTIRKGTNEIPLPLVAGGYLIEFHGGKLREVIRRGIMIIR
jgi:hypothetical protein